MTPPSERASGYRPKQYSVYAVNLNELREPDSGLKRTNGTRVVVLIADHVQAVAAARAEERERICKWLEDDRGLVDTADFIRTSTP